MTCAKGSRELTANYFHAILTSDSNMNFNQDNCHNE